MSTPQEYQNLDPIGTHFTPDNIKFMPDCCLCNRPGYCWHEVPTRYTDNKDENNSYMSIRFYLCEKHSMLRNTPWFAQTIQKEIIEEWKKRMGR
jgi:hypothetical protein